MKVYVCDDCGTIYPLTEKPEQCACGAKDSFFIIENIEKNRKCGNPFSKDEIPSRSARDEA